MLMINSSPPYIIYIYTSPSKLIVTCKSYRSAKPNCDMYLILPDVETAVIESSGQVSSQNDGLNMLEL
jgi:hypothetical protein